MPLFPQPTRERALELLVRFPLGSRLVQRLRKCQGACCAAGPSHGPYWFADVPSSAGKPRERYVGSDEKARELQAAWSLIEAEIANAELSPAVQELRRLEALAGRRGVVRAQPDVVVQPSLSMGGGMRPPK